MVVVFTRQSQGRPYFILAYPLRYLWLWKVLDKFSADYRFLVLGGISFQTLRSRASLASRNHAPVAPNRQAARAAFASWRYTESMASPEVWGVRATASPIINYRLAEARAGRYSPRSREFISFPRTALWELQARSNYLRISTMYITSLASCTWVWGLALYYSPRVHSSCREELGGPNQITRLKRHGVKFRPSHSLFYLR